MSGKRIVFTGGSGKAGRHAIPHLVAHGYSVLNVDMKTLDGLGVPTLIADLTDNGQAFNALTTHPTFGGFEHGRPPQPPDGVTTGPDGGRLSSSAGATPTLSRSSSTHSSWPRSSSACLRR